MDKEQSRRKMIGALIDAKISDVIQRKGTYEEIVEYQKFLRTEAYPAGGWAIRVRFSDTDILWTRYILESAVRTERGAAFIAKKPMVFQTDDENFTPPSCEGLPIWNLKGDYLKDE